MSSADGRFWTSRPDGYIEPAIAATGFASLPARTVIQQLKDTRTKHGGCNAMAVKRITGKNEKGHNILSNWQFWTWNQYYDDCCRFAKSILKLGFTKFGTVNIMGFNSPEWFIADIGTIVAGGIAAGVYSTNLEDSCRYISDHSQAQFVVVEDNKQLAKYAAIQSKGKLPHLKAIVVWGEDPTSELATKCQIAVYSWKDFLEVGKDVPETTLTAAQEGIRPGNCCSLIYTSGTTGMPKAVMISHDNVTWTTKNITQHYMTLNHEDRVVSYLPLSHIAAQLIDLYAGIDLGLCTYFAQPDALKGTLTVTLKDVRPTIFFGVPRVWEKMAEFMQGMARDITGVKKTMSTWAKSCGKKHLENAQFGGDSSKPWGYGCANTLVLSKIKDALGLDQAKGCFTAAAPISADTLWYFASVDIPVFEVFGQSECTGPHTVSFYDNWKIGTCGRPIQGSKSRIVPENGELTYKGRHIFMGYMYGPEDTAKTIDEEGYLHSGDVAEFDKDEDTRVESPSGFMKITGRIKELIITAGGENIPPVLIENEMKSSLPALSNCMVVGDKKKFLTMLITLKTKVDPDTNTLTDELTSDALFVSQQIESTARKVGEAQKCEKWTKYIETGRLAANKKAASAAQAVQKWTLLSEDFSEKAGQLTPTLKLKRSVVAKQYDAIIEAMYAGSE